MVNLGLKHYTGYIYRLYSMKTPKYQRKAVAEYRKRQKKKGVKIVQFTVTEEEQEKLKQYLKELRK